VIDIRV